MNDTRKSPILSLVSNRSDREPKATQLRDSNAPDLERQTSLSEIFAGPRDAGALGFALAQIPQHGRILWVQDRMAALETGRPCGQAFSEFGTDAEQLALACARTGADVLWTMEEGLTCSSLAAIIGEVWGDPQALDFTATKRLAMRAERQGVPVFLIRFGGSANLSAARRRWRVTSLPSLPDPHDDRAPGTPRWRAELFRARGAKPGVWEAHYDAAAHQLHLDAALRDPALATPLPAAMAGQ
ncbi:MAG: recA-like protein [Pacificimonas sp.]